MPLALGALGKGEGKKDEGNGGTEDREADNVKLLGKEPYAAKDRNTDLGLEAGGRGRIDEPEPLCLALSPEEGNNERREGCRDEDGEHAIAPAPTGTLQDLGCDVGADEARAAGDEHALARGRGQELDGREAREGGVGDRLGVLVEDGLGLVRGVALGELGVAGGLLRVERVDGAIGGGGDDVVGAQVEGADEVEGECA